MPDPQHFPAADLARRMGDVLDAAVTITRHRKPRFVPMSVERYAAMTGGGQTQQAHTLDDMPAELKAAMVAALERDLAASEAAREDRQG
jgi:PHD/YefM family antitoxin component YafN of YafNO toxin-antitoxin module